jgi:hypothetical protein
MKRHPPTQAAFDNGNASWQGRTSFDGGLLMKVADQNPAASNSGVLYRLPKPRYNFSLKCFDDAD